MNSSFKNSNVTYDYQTKDLNVSYVACELLVAVLAVVGNALVIHVFRKEKRLRRRTNYYIVSLATADLLVGLLGIPFAILSSVGLPTNLHFCLFTVSLLVVLCTISIFCLVAVSVDRYWAILHPMGYSRNVRTKTALVIISICWFAGTLIGLLPLTGWHKDTPTDVDCFFLNVMDYNYLVFLYFGTIITPAVILVAFYAHIYRVVLKQLRQIVVMNPDKASGKKCKNLSSGGMIRMLNVQQRNEVKATQNLAIIVLFFMICWIPLYTINCLIAFYKDFHVNSTFMFSCIILSHLNSAGNPLLYAYHLKDFRAALKNFFCGLLGIEQEFPARRATVNTIRQRGTFCKVDYDAKKVSAIVKNSAILASVPTEDVKKTIWTVAEDSGRDSASSENSIHNDTILMLRPATPYKTNIVKELNQAYDSSSLDDSEDAYMDEYSKCYTLKEETSMSVVNKVSHLADCSKSSLQLSKEVFLVENETGEEMTRTSYLRVPSSPKQTNRLSPCKMVSNMFRNKRKLDRSLSDSGSLKKTNGVMVDYYSVPM